MAGNRRFHSVRGQLLSKAREAALTAIQTFNNPLVHFKSETFIVLMVIAWTYLLHAYYKGKGIEYRRYEQKAKRRKYLRTKSGSFKYLELTGCLENEACPLPGPVQKNLMFLLGLRHEIEHHMPPRLDDYMSGRYQACCVNFNTYIKQLFGGRYGIDQQLTYSIQFVRLASDQVTLNASEDIPDNVRTYIASFDEDLAQEELDDPEFSVRFLFSRRLTGNKGQADQVVEFLPLDSDVAQEANKAYALIKEKETKAEWPKYRVKQIVRMMRDEGFSWFNANRHADLWKKLDAKNEKKGYGTFVAEGDWYWYGNWIDEVRKFCSNEARRRALEASKL